jgi:hypothetical protein
LADVRLLGIVLFVIALLPLPGYAGEPGQTRTPDAVVVRLTEADANRFLVGAFRAKGGPVFTGSRADAGRGMHGVSYELRLSEPILALGSTGAPSMSLSFDILDADVTIERIERKILGQLARCEGAGLFVEPGRPLALALDLGLVVADGDLRLVPLEARSPGAREAIHLIKPERCRNTVVPTWLLWSLGKSHLRRSVERVDRLLLDRARRAAADLAQDGLVREEWIVGSTRFRLEAQSVATDGGALTVSFDGLRGAAGDERGISGPPAVRPALPADRSAIAISERLVNEAIGAAFDGLSAKARTPSGDLKRLVRSEAVLALIPGLRDLEVRSGLQFQLRLGTPPHVRFAASVPSDPCPSADVEQVALPAADRAVVTVEVENVALDVLRPTDGEPQHLGTLTIDRGRVRAVPFVNRINGIAFEPVENSWRLSSTGIAFDEPLLAATIQELVFGILFETRTEPLAPEGFRVGNARLAARSFTATDGYLVVTLGDVAEPPAATQHASAMQTRSLRASR